MALALVAAGLAASGTTPHAAAAASDGACADADGVTVVVDFRELGGATIVRCARGAVEDGLHALRVAGIAYDTAVRFPGLVCRIEGRPAEEPCQNAPPADAYWSYWHAEHGGGWTYSQRGPSSRTPPPGSSEGWSFSTGAQAPPRTAPTTYPAAPQPPPSPTEVPTPPEPDPAPPPPPPPPPQEPSEPPPPAPPPAQPAAGESTAAAPTEPDPTAATPRRSPRPARTATPAPTPTPTPTPSPAGELLRTASAEDDAGSPVGTVVGLALIVVLAAAAGVTAWRRRSSP